jgi:hypothetical protein
MKLNEINKSELAEEDVPIIFHLMVGLLKKHIPIRYIRFKAELNTWVEGVSIEYDDIAEEYNFVVTLHDKDASSHAYSMICWVIPRMIDQLILEKRAEGFVFLDPDWCPAEYPNT